jgi:hypothetical protein
MKKISIILAVLLIGCTFTFKNANANAHPKDEGFPEGFLQAIPVPVYCAPTFQLLTAMMEVFGMKYVVSADVRTGGLPEGNLIGTTSFWYNEKSKKGIFTMTMTSTGLTCMMSFGINFKFDQDMMLDIINEELK